MRQETTVGTDKTETTKQAFISVIVSIFTQTWLYASKIGSCLLVIFFFLFPVDNLVTNPIFQNAMHPFLVLLSIKIIHPSSSCLSEEQFGQR